MNYMNVSQGPPSLLTSMKHFSLAPDFPHTTTTPRQLVDCRQHSEK